MNRRISRLPEAMVAIALLLCAAGTPAQTAARQVVIYDGQRYGPAEAEAAVRAPIAVASPRYGGGNEVFIPRSPDGLHYLHGFVNGLPVVFVIDSGATTVAIPESIARNAGIRAGYVVDVKTAGGRVRGGRSEGNRIGVGPILVDHVTVAVQPGLHVSLLGMNVLGKFKVVQDAAGMTLTLGNP